MICEKCCKVAGTGVPHIGCKGGTWCDCQHMGTPLNRIAPLATTGVTAAEFAATVAIQRRAM